MPRRLASSCISRIFTRICIEVGPDALRELAAEIERIIQAKGKK